MSSFLSKRGTIALLIIAGMLGAAVQAASSRVDERVSAALRVDPKPSRGKALYEANCASCHGKTARGDAERAIPALAGQRQTYLIKQLADFTEIERDSKLMHGVASRALIAKPQAMADLAAHISALPVAELTGHGDGTRLGFGETIFREQCAACHGDDARGDPEGFVPSLRNQHYSYLMKQMQGFVSWHRRDVDEGLIRFFQSLAPDELTAVADYISRLQGPGQDSPDADPAQPAG